MKKGILKHKSFAFAIRTVNLYKYQIAKNKDYVLNKQILHSGTYVGAHIGEVFNGESPIDFVHKLSMAQKECNETLYVLEFLLQTEFLSPELCDSISKETVELLKLITKSSFTAKAKLTTKYLVSQPITSHLKLHT